jgi:hypothetical protein
MNRQLVDDITLCGGCEVFLGHKRIGGPLA